MHKTKRSEVRQLQWTRTLDIRIAERALLRDMTERVSTGITKLYGIFAGANPKGVKNKNDASFHLMIPINNSSVSKEL
jgi:hypothetical protein